ncbi:MULTISPECIES: hypothetical protein [Polaribacter]|uniref:Uncharacterized protein n=1 Tax=Polaribacter ponticola TaxID=2978475 RepID=A0ABT5S7L2_9FLAO|nr:MULTISPECIES: hypothetical protein [Polaribacter]MDD7914093.1 hypothetical protein [Polaribacter sp. MSW5]
MSENENYLLKLMQNVVDNLDRISNKIDQLNNDNNEDKLNSISNKIDIVNNKNHGIKLESLNKKILEISEELKRIFKNSNNEVLNKKKLEVSLEKISKNLEKTIQNHKTPINNSIKKEIIIFGKDSPFTSKLLLISIICLLIFSYGFKYIPPYLKERNTNQLEIKNYQNFYNYLYLLYYKDDGKLDNQYSRLLNKIKQNDSAITKEYNQLFNMYNKSIKKKELEKQLKELE